MPTAFVPVDEYLKTSSDGHREYVDGLIIDKAKPTWMHAVLQAWISALIMRRYPQYLAGTEVHARLKATEFRLPDIAVQRREIAERESYAEQPPVLCVEILSPEDRLGAVFAKCESYHDWGVQACWVIDPIRRRAWNYERQGEPEPAADILIASGIRLMLADVFSILDGAPAAV